MNKKYLLSSVMAGSALLYANQGMTQCLTTQDCTALGYTESSCPNGGIKCPFGNTWSCTPPCDPAYKYTCSGTNITGGSGSTCDGKYFKCTCADGYTWDATRGECKSSCTIGALYYSDGICSDEFESSKTLLGVVIYEKSASESGWIMAVEPVATSIYWSKNIDWFTRYKDIPGLTNITSLSKLTDIQASCTNTNIITAYGDSSTYPAAWVAKYYSPSGTPSGKSWCLPSGGLLNNLNNSVILAKVNAGITTAGGTKLGYVYNSRGYYEIVWSSSEYSDKYAWVFVASPSSFNMDNGHKYDNYDNYDDYNYSVRPVMEF